MKQRMMMVTLLLGVLGGNLSLKAQPNETLEWLLKKRRTQSANKVPTETKKVMQKGIEELRDKGLAAKAVGVGQKLPVLYFEDLEGNRVRLESLYKKQPVVLTFYRGHWCPYCMLELEAYEKMRGEFEKAGAVIVAVSPDKQLEAQKTKDKRELNYKVWTDPNNRAAKTLGLAFKVDPGTLKIYKKFGIDLVSSQGNEENRLPMPGTYVIDTEGKVRYSFVDPDYTKRAEPATVLKVVKDL